MKSNAMKKNSFIEGTIVATMGIFLVKVIGIIYVILIFIVEVIH